MFSKKPQHEIKPQDGNNSDSTNSHQGEENFLDDEFPGKQFQEEDNFSKQDLVLDTKALGRKHSEQTSGSLMNMLNETMGGSFGARKPSLRDPFLKNA